MNFPLISMIKINGIPFPYPSRELTIQRIQPVDSERNANYEVVASKITDRRIFKLDGLVFPYLPANAWNMILTEIEKFEGTLEFFDARLNRIAKYKVYWGDSSEKPFEVDTATGNILSFVDCTCNIIDMGFDEVID